METEETKKRIKIIRPSLDEIRKRRLEAEKDVDQYLANYYQGACPVDELDPIRRRKFLDREITI